MKVSDVSQPDSGFFLKSVYGPLSETWPTLTFTKRQFATFLRTNYRPSRDFVLFTGTTDPRRTDDEYRGRLLSLLKVSLSAEKATEDYVEPAAWRDAQTRYPGQWGKSFLVTEGWNFVDYPLTSEIAPSSFSVMGQYPYPGTAKRLEEFERDRILELQISIVDLRMQPAAKPTLLLHELRRNPQLNRVSTRIAELVQNRIDASGSLKTTVSPQRNGLPKSDLVLLIAEKLQAKPLLCELCGGILSLEPENKLLQPSPDRIDSKLTSYGPENFQISHLGCNLAKNKFSIVEFQEWLQVAATPLLFE